MSEIATAVHELNILEWDGKPDYWIGTTSGRVRYEIECWQHNGEAYQVRHLVDVGITYDAGGWAGWWTRPKLIGMATTLAAAKLIAEAHNGTAETQAERRARLENCRELRERMGTPARKARA